MRVTPAAALATCGVWWSAPDGDPADPLLDDAERARCAGLRAPDDRARFVTGRLLARRALAAELRTEPAAIRLVTRCPRCGGPHGKPVLAAPPAQLAFSISHAGDRVVVATSRGPAIGVDVERVAEAQDLMTPDAGVLCAAERAALDALASDERDAAFTRLWTRKEAVLKATGEGLLGSLAQLRVTDPGEPPDVVSWPAGRPQRRVRMLDLDAGPGYQACLAVLTDQPPRVTSHARLRASS